MNPRSEAITFLSAHENLDYQIAFYEELIKDDPDFIEALIAVGDAYTKRGRYDDGLHIDERLVEMKPDDPVIRYNLACSYSLVKMSDPCLKALEKAFELGYNDLEFMEADPDLDFIKKDPRFKELLSRFCSHGQ